MKVQFDGGDLASLGSTVASAALTIYGIVAPYFYAVPLGSILLTVSLSFFLQRTIQKSTRRYEQQRVLITEALSGVHGELLSNSETFTKNRLTHYASVIPDVRFWDSIRSSYRYYLVPK